MIKEYKIGNVARDWIVRYQSETERDIMLANINRIMNNVITSYIVEEISDKETLDMLVTLSNVSSLIDSIGKEE